jgi:hypothetical protein
MIPPTEDSPTAIKVLSVIEKTGLNPDGCNPNIIL